MDVLQRIRSGVSGLHAVRRRERAGQIQSDGVDVIREGTVCHGEHIQRERLSDFQGLENERGTEIFFVFQQEIEINRPGQTRIAVVLGAVKFGASGNGPTRSSYKRTFEVYATVSYTDGTSETNEWKSTAEPKQTVGNATDCAKREQNGRIYPDRRKL